ncbi:helix-turn-helix domain-containing protein [Chitinophaga sp. 212800010-3]|uniref:AraC family transcriptional regulator n=1 Tax=unclassified Chitinophaga TaxID=2619133 RepID=UPI002DED0AE2|nr:HTH araC/xylS-type domain-containing protein [Chitinophaga sp. 212800010-3]
MSGRQAYHQFRIPVPAAFEEVFVHFYFAENKSGETITQTLLPSYQTIMVFSFGAPASFISKQHTQVTMDKCLVAGPIRQSLEYSLAPNAAILVANFKDDAFYRFFGDASIAAQQPVHPDSLFNENCFTALWTELNEMDNVQHQVDHILEFCRPYLRNRSHIAQQLSGFTESNISVIKETAQKNNLSERAIQINHKKLLGYSAKELSRYQRFMKAVQLIQTSAVAGSGMDWFEIVVACGYYDQSQLIHDFKHYLNLSPSKYLQFQQDICNPLP